MSAIIHGSPVRIRLPSKSRDARQHSSNLVRPNKSSNKESQHPVYHSHLAPDPDASLASITNSSSSPSILKRVNTSPRSFFIHIVFLRLVSHLDRSFHSGEQSSSTSRTIPFLSGLSISSDTPSTARYDKNNYDGPSIDKLTSFVIEFSATSQDENNYFHLTHIQAMLDLLQQTHCCLCHRPWVGNVSTSKRESKVLCLFRSAFTAFLPCLGMSSRFVSTCWNISNETTMHSSPQVPNSRHREINICSQSGSLPNTVTVSLWSDTDDEDSTYPSCSSMWNWP